jgi:hypothetical protein
LNNFEIDGSLYEIDPAAGVEPKISSSVIAGATTFLPFNSTDFKMRRFYSGARANKEPLMKILVSPANDA